MWIHICCGPRTWKHHSPIQWCSEQNCLGRSLWCHPWKERYIETWDQAQFHRPNSWMDGILHSHEIVNKIPSRTDAGSNRFGTVCSGTNQNTGTQLPIGDGIRNYCGLNTSRHTRKTSAAQATQQIPATVFDGRLGHYKKRRINLQLTPWARPYSQWRPYPVPFQRKKLFHEELCVWRISRLNLGGTAPSDPPPRPANERSTKALK